jgi:hypothetical protein
MVILANYSVVCLKPGDGGFRSRTMHASPHRGMYDKQQLFALPTHVQDYAGVPRVRSDKSRALTESTRKNAPQTLFTTGL